MEQDAFYSVKVELKTEDDKGRIKRQTENYLVKAVSVTDAEAIVNEDFKHDPIEFEVKSVNKTNIVNVLNFVPEPEL